MYIHFSKYMNIWVHICVCVFVFVWALIHIHNPLRIFEGSCWPSAFHLFIFLMGVCLRDFEIIFLRNQKHSVSIGCTYCHKQSRLILHCLVSEHIAKHIKMFM